MAKYAPAVGINFIFWPLVYRLIRVDTPLMYYFKEILSGWGAYKTVTLSASGWGLSAGWTDRADLA